jgi:cytidylate kinase
MDVIAIDGPAATGKTTTAAGVARELGFVYVDSGAIYRTAALAVARAPENRDLRSVLRSAGISAEAGPHGFRVLVHGKTVSDEIRTPEITRMSSVLATRKEVRERVVEILRELAQTSGSPLVVEGRDIGTVVFPDALLKVFMVADLEERAKRRLRDLEAKGVESSVQDVETELAERDGRDSGRAVAPLARHPEAILVDTTQLTIPEQIQVIVGAYREKKATLH